jgi:hypothetical protein
MPNEKECAILHLESEVMYTDAIIDQAAEAFFRDFFRTPLGRALMLASVVSMCLLVRMHPL